MDPQDLTGSPRTSIDAEIEAFLSRGDPLAKEQNFQRGERCRFYPPCILTNSCSRTVCALTGVAAVIAIILVVAVVCGSLHGGRTVRWNEDLNFLGPRTNTKTIAFWNESSWVPDPDSGISSEESQQRWLSITPRGDWFVKIRDPHLYDLPRPIAKEGRDGVYGFAVGHQLHCLYIIMDDWVGLQQGLGRASAHGEDPWLMRHCFDYLRQSIMCCGDTALEGHQTGTYQDPDLPSPDGWGVKHVCKNYDQLIDWMEAHRLYDAKSMQ